MVNGVGHINKVKLRRAQLVLGLMTICDRSNFPVFPRALSLAIPLWVGAMLSATAAETNGEFCVAVGPVTRTADILAYYML